MATWQDDTLGAFGSASQIPTGEWFPVDTTTGQWGTPTPATPTLATAAGMPDVTAPPVWGGMPDQAPLSIGQVAGPSGFAPQLGPQPAMNRLARLDDLGALTPEPGVWESLARGIAMASPQGRAILQYGDQQAQQQLTNRLAARRQALAEEQNERAEIRDDFNTFVKLSEIKSKALRNLYTDRFVADRQARGKSLPADFVEAFKKTGIDEGQQMAKLLEPLLTESGLDPAVATQLLAEGRSPKDIMDAMEMAQKQKKLRLEQQESTSLTEGLATLGGASGTAQPAPGTPPPAANVGMRETPGGKEPLPIRMNNPLNIKQGPATQKWIDQGVGVPGDPATDGGRFIKFQTPQQGVAAAKDLLTGPTYSGLSVDAALKKWSNNGYGGEMVTGVDPTKQIADLTPGELTRTMGAMMQREGGGTGGTVSRDQVAGPGAPSQEPARLAQLNQQIAAMDQFLQANIGRGSERTRAAVTQVERLRDNLTKERDQLTEPSRAGMRARTEAEMKADVEERVQGRQTAAEVLGDRVTTFFDKATGEQESPGQSMTEMRKRLADKQVAVLSTDQAKQLSVLKQLEPVLDGYKRLVEYAYDPKKGPLKDYARQPFQTVQAMYDQVAQKDPQFQALRRSLEGQLQSVVRALGSRGDLNAQELDAAKGLLANFDVSLGLGLSLGPMFGSSGMGVGGTVKPSISRPDTPQTGMRVANELFGLVNQRIGSLLGNPGYKKNALLEVPETPPPNPDDPAYGFGYIPKEVMEARQQRARQAPQASAPPPAPAAVVPQAPGVLAPPAASAAVPPASGQRALRAMSPAQLRQLPDALARAVIANPGMEQGLSPEQKEALADGLERWERSQARR